MTFKTKDEEIKYCENSMKSIKKELTEYNNKTGARISLTDTEYYYFANRILELEIE